MIKIERRIGMIGASRSFDDEKLFDLENTPLLHVEEKQDLQQNFVKIQNIHEILSKKTQELYEEEKKEIDSNQDELFSLNFLENLNEKISQIIESNKKIDKIVIENNSSDEKNKFAEFIDAESKALIAVKNLMDEFNVKNVNLLSEAYRLLQEKQSLLPQNEEMVGSGNPIVKATIQLMLGTIFSLLVFFGSLYGLADFIDSPSQNEMGFLQLAGSIIGSVLSAVIYVRCINDLCKILNNDLWDVSSFSNLRAKQEQWNHQYVEIPKIKKEAKAATQGFVSELGILARKSQKQLEDSPPPAYSLKLSFSNE